ncbi:DUF6457 domain-containing protein [Nocardioides sp.]|uniref:DUF6457 domain-containing protein n=1 Tax=Nocardioides sp. TaxID=35761 RepID=UPI0035113D60
MNLHDWIDELCDLLDLETEVDEGLVNDLAEVAHDNVDRLAGPVTAYLLGYAAASRGAGPATVERLAARATELAEAWDKPAAEVEDDDVEPDDVDPLALGGALTTDDDAEDGDDSDDDSEEEE